MDFSRYAHLSAAACGLAVVFVLYQLYTRVNIHIQQNAYKRSKGVLPAPWLPGSDRIIGIRTFRDDIRALKENRLLPQTQARFRQVGASTFQCALLGRHTHFTIEPENLKTIQAVDFKKWGLTDRRKNGLKPLLGNGIFTSDGFAWQHSREMLRPNFARTQVADLDTFERHIQHLIANVPTDNSTVDLSDLFFRLTMDSATEFLFGESTESLTRQSGEGFAESFNRSQEHVARTARYGRAAALLPANKQYNYDQKFVHDFVDYYVQKGLAKRDELLSAKADSNTTGRYIFLEEIVRQTSDPLQVRSELLNVLLAGRDTTASLLTNVWFTLANRPDIWAKLQAEVATLNGDRPTFETLKDMKYLRGVLNESLRLYPVVPNNSRMAVEDTTLPRGGGPDGLAPVFIKKGEIVVFSPYVMHRRKDYYGEDAEEFKVERWLDDAATGKKGLRPGWEYLPFNGGARICLGQQFALTEAGYTTTRLCQMFDKIESRDSAPWKEALTLTCVNLGGAKVALTQRSV